jgi:hypothetical protein
LSIAALFLESLEMWQAVALRVTWHIGTLHEAKGLARAFAAKALALHLIRQSTRLLDSMAFKVV